MIHKVRWDNAPHTSNVTYSFTRSDQAVADNGATLSTNAPRYSTPKLICPAPLLTARRNPATQMRVWGGRWLNGDPCLVEKWFSTTSSDVYVAISTPTYPAPDTSRQVNIGPSSVLMSAGGYDHIPQTFVVSDGSGCARD